MPGRTRSTRASRGAPIRKGSAVTGARPRVGITCSVSPRQGEAPHFDLTCDHRLAEAVADAGGEPVLLPIARSRVEVEQQLGHVTGVVVGGGDDIDPALFGERPRPGTEPVDPRRTRYDRWLYDAVLRRDLPFFGVCYGMQLCNVLEGGTLRQDLPRRGPGAQHRGGPGELHDVELLSGSWMADLVARRRAAVPTQHHQGIAIVADAFRVSACADDGLVEALEHRERAHLFGVQWHPERAPRSRLTRALFERFVQLCALSDKARARGGLRRARAQK